jgi:predicted acylesterase/phospholipase RssA
VCGNVTVSRAVILAALLLSLAGCTVTREYALQPGSTPPTVDEEPKTCLALSGGGIRSGATSLGVLQRLHELHVLGNVTYVASVSGGGYPVYGLVYELTQNGRTLDGLLDEHGTFLAEIESRSAFAIARTLVHQLAVSSDLLLIDKPRRWFRPKPGRVMMSNASAAYEADIHRKFTGALIPVRGTPELRDIEDLAARGFPYPIFIASANEGRSAPSREHVYSEDYRDLFELSPLWLGGDTFGYWSHYDSDLALENAIAMSGAAIDAPDLRHEGINAPMPNLLKKLSMGLGGSLTLKNGKEVYLADGGFIENQAILPLVRRGCRTILALDATSDQNASFAGILRAQSYLRRAGWVVSDLEPHQPRRTDSSESGWQLPSHVWRFTATGPQGRWKSRVFVLKLGIVPDEDYPQPVEEFLQQTWKGAGRLPECRRSGLLKGCDFPLEATIRQSYSAAEFRAYRFLGRHLVDEWRRAGR